MPLKILYLVCAICCAHVVMFADELKLGDRAPNFSLPYSHKEWAARLNVQFALLSDHEHSVAKIFGSFNAETGFNKRMIYVIGRDARIVYIDSAYRLNSTDSFNNLKEALKGQE